MFLTVVDGYPDENDGRRVSRRESAARECVVRVGGIGESFRIRINAVR